MARWLCKVCNGPVPFGQCKTCSPECNELMVETRERVRKQFVFPDECEACGRELPPQTTGRPRTYCSLECSTYALRERRAKAREFFRRGDRDVIDGVDPGGGFSVERPLPTSRVDESLTGAGDADLEPYMAEGWAVEFVADHGFAGPDVGQTFPLAGRTLGGD